MAQNRLILQTGKSVRLKRIKQRHAVSAKLRVQAENRNATYTAPVNPPNFLQPSTPLTAVTEMGDFS